MILQGVPAGILGVVEGVHIRTEEDIALYGVADGIELAQRLLAVDGRSPPGGIDIHLRGGISIVRVVGELPIYS